LLLARWTKVNSLLLVLSFPLWGLLWLGLLDWLIACGLVLFLLAKYPALRGFGILLAMLKLQLSVLAILVLLLQEKPLTILKITTLPLAGFLLSLWVYGIRRAAAPLAAGRVGYVALRDIFHLAAIPFPQPAPATGCQPVGFVNSHSLFWGIFLRYLSAFHPDRLGRAPFVCLGTCFSLARHQCNALRLDSAFGFVGLALR